MVCGRLEKCLGMAICKSILISPQPWPSQRGIEKSISYNTTITGSTGMEIVFSYPGRDMLTIIEGVVSITARAGVVPNLSGCFLIPSLLSFLPVVCVCCFRGREE